MHLTLPLRLSLKHHPGQSVALESISISAVTEWCLALCLLREGVAEAVSVREEAGNGKLEIQAMSQAGSQVRTRARLDAGSVHLALTPRDLEYLLHFFLRYYRDGVAEVDHLDLEVVTGTEDQEVSITFKVPESAPPLSASMARRRLGLR